MTEPKPRVVHLLGAAGSYSEIWLDALIRSTERYESEAWRQFQMVEPVHWVSRPTHVKSQHPLADLAVRLWRTDRLRGVLRPLARGPAALAVPRLGPEPAVLHAHFGPAAWQWLGLIAKWNAPLVVSFYGYDASLEEFCAEPWTSRYRDLCRRTAAVIVEGPAMARKVERLGFPEDIIHVVRLPFANVKLPAVDKREPKWDVVMAGRFVEKKGFAIGLEAVAKASPDLDALVVGGGPGEDELREHVRRLGIADRVTFMPPVPLAELAELIIASKMMVFPSLTAPDGDGEGGAPMALTLAQALGTPVIVSDHDDLPWAAAPGTPQVPAEDAAALASAVSELHRGIGQGHHRGQVETARRFVEREHDPARLVTAREAVYDQASAGAQGEGPHDATRRSRRRQPPVDG